MRGCFELHDPSMLAGLIAVTWERYLNKDSILAGFCGGNPRSVALFEAVYESWVRMEQNFRCGYITALQLPQTELIHSAGFVPKWLQKMIYANEKYRVC
ncbi:hypothetical protein CDAR_376211 [Caerostris darwini]|uniref:Uncharacterized protein n=1 Tax=Caerostris darwini TaxID=1538125 RepID=A0AAV4PHI7_9ARAC|nr:hypothetical protein CDAR_376211 [Caerostris darwini]